MTAPTSGKDAASVSIMACHRLDRGAHALRRQATDLSLPSQPISYPEMQACRSAFEAMLSQLGLLLDALESLCCGSALAPPLREQYRQFASTITMILEDSETLTRFLDQIRGNADPALPPNHDAQARANLSAFSCRPTFCLSQIARVLVTTPGSPA